LKVGTHALQFIPGYKSTNYPEYWRAWIDYNQNHVFEANEVIYSSGPSAGSQSNIFTLPASALLGATRMRIIMSYGTINNACGNFTFGEAEDYLINIVN